MPCHADVVAAAYDGDAMLDATLRHDTPYALLLRHDGAALRRCTPLRCQDYVAAAAMLRHIR